MYLIVGANGFLGSYIIKNIIDKTDDNIIAVARNVTECDNSERIKWRQCDISNYDHVDNLISHVSSFSNLKIVFLAACHHPDYVEDHSYEAWNINVTALSYFINRLEGNVSCLFYPSTDSVYGDSINGYKFKESDKLKPVNLYGKNKCAAESIIKWHGYNVVRFPFLIGASKSKNKKHFYDNIVSDLKSGRKVEMFEDSYRSALNFDAASTLLLSLIENYHDRIPKILNICSDEVLSKYDIGLKIADSLNVKRSLIVPIRSTNDNAIFSAKRAKSTLMDNSLLKSILSIDKISFCI